MALFEKKGVVPQVPGVAECDAMLAQLGRRKQEVIYRLGCKYADNNTVADAAGTIYEAELKELEDISREADHTEVKKLALQGLRKCEKCGNVLVVDSAFCNKCGEKLAPLQVEMQASTAHCPQCGNPVESDAVFCTACGNKL